eukprot:TRINITY_DN51547_c0_g1_i1.p1 TRINITY_DN51547_c0_g1~~TRINITY_DN51547_c0_g1_i1.p1  ORF type:complete len:324 (+),score=71.97 TRINITY_DN51547_c0_g1_i1:72-1043(+)
MSSGRISGKEAAVGSTAIASPQAVPEAPLGPLQQTWPELGKAKAADASGPGRPPAGQAERVADALRFHVEEPQKADDAEDDDEEEDADEDGDATCAGSGRRRRRRRRRNRGATSQAIATSEALVPNFPSEMLGMMASEEEAATRSRNVVTWNDLLGVESQGLKPESPSGGFQCAPAACWRRPAQQQLQHQQETPLEQLRQAQMQHRHIEMRQMEIQQMEMHQQAALIQAAPQQQEQPLYLQQACWDVGSPVAHHQTGKAAPFIPASFGSTAQWVVTDTPAEWSPSHTEELRNWLCESITQGSVPHLSELDVVLQGLASEAYED